LNRGLPKNFCCKKANKSCLFARAKEHLSWIWKTGAADKAQADSIGGGCDRNDTVRGTFVRTKPDHEEVVVVLGELGCCGKTLPQRLAGGAYDRLMRRLEFVDKMLQLFLWIR
jgi:hypothetical protein